MSMPSGVTTEQFFGDRGWFDAEFLRDPVAAFSHIVDKLPLGFYADGALEEIIRRVAQQHPDEFNEWLARYVENIRLARRIDPDEIEGSLNIPDVLRSYVSQTDS